ncbi:tripartite tricarboxylate transporter TctB family protein [Agrococcus jejuensis]|uniref:Tripartite tricarboxylate transporter TctB family protein n=1 Tax=Agrococcus jejuensis TaxID=399736 RepID=A0A1G8DZM4_9MICO|nr:tripartite tricarboxylate transporter TctB family protein [Agrococcus jejuensis]SDH63103.1 Tripartite tricarboxylate transporter TctB family protein [Agrococcus jejuensis]
MLTGLGLVFAIGALAFDLGTPLALGPGAFPLAAACVLVVLGVAIGIRAFVAPTIVHDEAPEALVADAAEHGIDAAADRPSRPAAFGRIPWRPAVLVTAAVAWFALTVDGLGLLLAASGTVVLASFARQGVRWWQPLVVGVGLTAGSWLIFVVGLRLRVPLLGDWLGG